MIVSVLNSMKRIGFTFGINSLLFVALCSISLAADWKPITVELLKSQKTGFGGLCGVVVFSPTGDLIVNLSDCGVFLSLDQGQN
jgi:hypothetical protein